MSGEQASPFHEGERAIQARYGLEEKVENMGRRVIRPFMPDQHRDFYEALPFIFVGSLDDQSRPWASMIWGDPGFIQSPDSTHLDFGVLPSSSDPLANHLQMGAPLGLLGLQLETRRRNRVNGQISRVTPHGFSFEVTQSFGNCPKYIQVRWLESHESSQEMVVSSVWDERVQGLIERADTFFIASAYTTGGNRSVQREAYGVDVSHRGGRPGFVTVLADGSFLFPDYRGNNMYNTLGNIVENPLTGYLFIDFETGSTLQLVGKSEVLWEPPPGLAFPSQVDKMVRFQAEQLLFRERVLPFRFSSPVLSPGMPELG